MTDEIIRVIAIPNPFSSDRVENEFAVGPSVGELLNASAVEPMNGCTIRVLIDDRVIPFEDLYRVVPKAGEVVTARVVPQDPVTITALLYAAMVTAGVAMAGGVTTAVGIATLAGTFIGSFAFAYGVGTAAESLAPKPAQGAFTPVKPWTDSPTITGARNELRAWSPVWRIFGRHRVTPPLGAKIYTEIVGGNQFLRMLFVVGYGPLQLSDMRIGETPITDYEDIETEIRTGYSGEPALTLFNQEVDTLAVNVKFEHNTAGRDLPEQSPWVERRSEPDTTEIGIDLTFPQGILMITAGRGYWLRAETHIEVQIKTVGGSYGPATVDLAGQPDAVDAGSGVVKFGGDTRDAFLRFIKIRNLAKGQYDVRLRIIDRVGTYETIFGDFVWTQMTSAKPLDPIKLDGLTKIALRARATDNLAGIIDQFNVLAESLVPIYEPGHPLADASGFRPHTFTRNPAWHFLEVLRGHANKRAVSDDRIDLATIKAWADANELAAYNFDGVFDFDSTVYEALQAIASSARASPHLRDSLFSVVRDAPRTTVVQHFTPRNSHGFKDSAFYPVQPHSLRVHFLNEEEDYQRDERLVYADGYDESNATLFESLDLFGITEPDRAWREGRYRLAARKYRNRICELNTDFEYLVCERGDLVRVTHDVALIGLAVGRIKTLTTDGGGDFTSMTLDETLTYETGKSYAVRIRSVDASGDTLSTVADISNPASGEDVRSNTVTFLTPIAAAKALELGNLVMFGEADEESEEFLVGRIQPSQDLGATLELIPYVEAVYTADGGTIPDHVPVITVPPDASPPVPVIESVESGTGELVLTLRVESTALVRAVNYQVQWRESGGGATWASLPLIPCIETQAHLGPAIDGTYYDIRVRSISAASVPSAFATIENVLYTGDDAIAADFEITGLELVEQGNLTEFVGRDASFAWRVNSPTLGTDTITGSGAPWEHETYVPDPLFRDFEIRVLDTETGDVLFTDHTSGPSYTFTFDQNIRAGNKRIGTDRGPMRVFTFDVAFRDVFERVSERASLTVSNPAPRKPISSSQDYYVFSAWEQVWIAFNQPRDTDYVGMLVFMEQDNPGFTPGQGNIAADQRGSPIVINATAGETMYVRIAPYDEFAVDPGTGRVNLGLLNMSDEEATTVQLIGEEDLAGITVTLFEESEVTTPVIDFIDYNDGASSHDWKEIDNVEITTTNGAVFFYGVFFAEVVEILPDIGIHDQLGAQPGIIEQLQHGMRVRYRIKRDTITIFESEDINLSVRGYFMGGGLSQIDNPGPGTHTYSMEIKWFEYTYTAGLASASGSTVTGLYTRWGHWDGAYTFEWKDAGTPKTVISITSDTVLTCFAPPGDRTNEEYILDFGGSNRELVVDLRRSLIQVSEFRL